MCTCDNELTYSLVMKLLSNEMNIYIYLCLLSFLFLSVSSQHHVSSDTYDYAKFATQWANQRHQMQSFIWPHQPSLVKLFDELSTNTSRNINDRCRSDLLHLKNGIQHFKRWSMEFVDAWSKMPSGFVRGKVADFGDYDMCLAASDPISNSVGKYCMISVNIPGPSDPLKAASGNQLSLANTSASGTWMEYLSELSPLFYGNLVRIGICVPSSCLDQEISDALNYGNLFYKKL